MLIIYNYALNSFPKSGTVDFLASSDTSPLSESQTAVPKPGKFVFPSSPEAGADGQRPGPGFRDIFEFGTMSKKRRARVAVVHSLLINQASRMRMFACTIFFAMASMQEPFGNDLLHMTSMELELAREAGRETAVRVLKVMCCPASATLAPRISRIRIGTT